MPRILGTILIGMALLVVPLTRALAQPADDVTLRVVNYDGLGEEIMKHRGKVVLVDFWSTLCIPCRNSFPQQVSLYRQYQKDGLVVISVSLNKNSEKKVDEIIRKAELNYLKKEGANFPNLILDEPWDLVMAKLGFDSIPALFVFDRQGRWKRFTGNDLVHEEKPYRYPEIEALVREYLKK